MSHPYTILAEAKLDRMGLSTQYDQSQPPDNRQNTDILVCDNGENNLSITKNVTEEENLH